jgi:hypothetical protein
LSFVVVVVVAPSSSAKETCEMTRGTAKVGIEVRKFRLEEGELFFSLLSFELHAESLLLNRILVLATCVSEALDPLSV